MERSSSQNKILCRNKIVVIHLFFLLGLCLTWVARSPQGWLMCRWAELQSWTAPVLTPSLHRVPRFHILHVQLYMLLNIAHLVLGLFTVCSYVSTPDVIGTLIALHARIFFPCLLDHLEGFLKREPKPTLPGYGLSHFPGCTHSECLEKCPSKSSRIKCHRQKQRWSSVRRSVTWSKNYVLCKDGEKSKLCIQDVEAVVLLPWGALVQPSEGCWDLHRPTRAPASPCHCSAIARRPHASSTCCWWSCPWLLAAESGCTSSEFPSD